MCRRVSTADSFWRVEEGGGLEHPPITTCKAVSDGRRRLINKNGEGSRLTRRNDIRLVYRGNKLKGAGMVHERTKEAMGNKLNSEITVHAPGGV